MVLNIRSIDNPFDNHASPSVNLCLQVLVSCLKERLHDATHGGHHRVVSFLGRAPSACYPHAAQRVSRVSLTRALGSRDQIGTRLNFLKTWNL